VSSPTAFDPIPVLEALTAHGVRFVVIGGFAGRLWGSNIITDDLDICYARDKKNYRALTAGLRELDARLLGEPDGILDRRTFESADQFTVETNAGIVDFVGTPAGSGGFLDLIRGATEMVIDSVRVDVAALEDLIWLKRASGRPNDLVELEILAALLEEIECVKRESRG
jgi:predicted nucleotidyltransferase